MTSTKNTHGGRREGSGRMRLGRVTMSVNVLPDTLAAIKARATAEGLNMGQYIDRIINA